MGERGNLGRWSHRSFQQSGRVFQDLPQWWKKSSTCVWLWLSSIIIIIRCVIITIIIIRCMTSQGWNGSKVQSFRWQCKATAKWKIKYHDRSSIIMLINADYTCKVTSLNSLHRRWNWTQPTPWSPEVFEYQRDDPKSLIGVLVTYLFYLILICFKDTQPRTRRVGHIYMIGRWQRRFLHEETFTFFHPTLMNYLGRNLDSPSTDEQWGEIFARVTQKLIKGPCHHLNLTQTL